MNEKAMIAMSGGVDSSVAAYLMKEQGFDCVGVTMKLFSNEDIGRDDVCCSLRDTDDARQVAYSLGIPHYVFNFGEDFRREVIRRFVEGYEGGHTPNPCIDCNRYIKFGRLLGRAREMECVMATGHYARIERGPGAGEFLLKKALDETKDQSYFLYSMTREQLERTFFPLGGLTKKEVREIAQAQGFLNARKRESQDVCFVTGGYADFIERYRGKPCEPGNFVDPAGGVLGRHRGLIRYTFGQRRGLEVSFRHRLYVCGKSVRDNTVTLGGEELLYAKAFFAEKINWISGPMPERVRAEAKMGYRRAAQRAAAWRVGEDRMRVEFDEPQKGTAAGQALVLYDGDVLLGGGVVAAS